VNRIRVLLTVEPRLLRDALHTLLAQDARLTVIDGGSRNVEILVGARQHRADVVVATFEATSAVPPLVTHLLGEFPEMLIVAIALREGRVRTYRSPNEVRIVPDCTVPAIIRTILRGASKGGQTDWD
jgi:hypothetical protein